MRAHPGRWPTRGSVDSGVSDGGARTLRPRTLARPPGGRAELPEQFGRYRILKRLGRGGMGAVYLAHDTQLDRQVALKVPHFTPEDGPEVLERFYREARAAATFDHPNLCPVYDVGQVDGVHYLTMAYIEGKPLSEVIDPDKPLPQRQAAAVVRKLALALEEAHRRGVIHRDLKPANIMINRRREPVIMDFGLARRDGGDDARLTRAGAVLGTPAYMAPEQVAGDVGGDRPALRHLQPGRDPVRAADRPAAVRGAGRRWSWARSSSPSRRRRRRIGPDLDPRLEAICLKAMAKKVADRYASMAELADGAGRLPEQRGSATRARRVRRFD